MWKAFFVFLILCLSQTTWAQWKKIDELGNREFIRFFEYSDTLFVSALDRVYLMDPNGSWTQTPVLPDGAEVIYGLHVDKHGILAGTYKGGAYRFTQNEWVPVNTGLPSNVTVKAITSWNNRYWLATDGHGVFSSTVQLKPSWKTENTGIPISIAGNIYSIGVFKDTLIVGAGGNGYLYWRSGSAAGFTEWPLTDPYIPGLQCEHVQQWKDMLLIGTSSNNVFVPNRVGKDATKTTDGINYGFYTNIVTSDSNVYMVKNTPYFTEYYYSPDGIKWTSFSKIYGIATHSLWYRDNLLYAARMDGIYVMDQTAVSTEPIPLPVNFELGQNYPNPFNPSTVIPFSLNKSGHVRLAIYGLDGSEVAVLIDQILPAGNHKKNFSVSDLSSGVYFYELKVDGQRFVRKMAFIK